MTRAGKAKLMTGLGRFYTVLVYIFLFLPISVIVVNSMNATTSKPYLSWKGFTLSWYVKLWSNTELLSSFGNTMIIAIVSTLVSTAIGTLAAVGLYRYRFRERISSTDFSTYRWSYLRSSSEYHCCRCSPE